MHAFRPWPFLLVIALASPAQAAPRQVKLSSATEKMDVTTLAPILATGDMSLVESYANGRLRQVTVFGLIKTPPAKVWAVLNDYEHFLDFMPSLSEFEIQKREGEDVIAEYEIEVPGSNLEYRLRHHPVGQTRIDISLYDDEGDINTGAWRWELVPFAGGTQTIVVYTLYTDVRESSWIIKQVLKSQPSMEHALNVATGLITIAAVKKRAER
jgi:ribosome-associated toxin RatA of RatAB toxin-antitoxin module